MCLGDEMMREQTLIARELWTGKSVAWHSELHDLDDVDLNDLDAWEHGVPYEWLTLLRREAPLFWQPEVDGRGFDVARWRLREPTLDDVFLFFFNDAATTEKEQR